MLYKYSFLGQNKFISLLERKLNLNTNFAFFINKPSGILLNINKYILRMLIPKIENYVYNIHSIKL